MNTLNFGKKALRDEISLLDIFKMIQLKHIMIMDCMNKQMAIDGFQMLRETP